MGDQTGWFIAEGQRIGPKHCTLEGQELVACTSDVRLIHQSSAVVECRLTLKTNMNS